MRTAILGSVRRVTADFVASRLPVVRPDLEATPHSFLVDNLAVVFVSKKPVTMVCVAP
jgi:hypothetical protein